MKQTRETIKTGILFRQAELQKRNDEEGRIIDISFSSEEPVERFFGNEVLDHTSKAMDLSFLRSGNAPFLVDHNPSDQVGIVEKAGLENKRGIASVRFGKSERAQEMLNDVNDGIRKNISVGYRVNEMELVKSNNEIDDYRVTSWTPLEISLVSIPADTTVGIGRAEQGEFETVVVRTIEEPETKVNKMTKEVKEKIDTNRITEETRKAELERIKNIEALAVRHNMRDFAEKSIQAGHSIDEFRGIVLDQIGNAKPLEQSPAEVDFTPKEKKRYSLMRAIEAASQNNWSKAGFESEVSREIEKKSGKSARGFYAPSNIDWGAPQKRDLTVGTDTAGGHLVPDDHLGDQYVEALRAQLVTAQAGARTLTGLTGDISIPGANAATVAYWVAESGAPTEGAPTFQNNTASPKTAAAYLDLSRRLLLQSDPSIEQLIREDVISVMAQTIDDVAIEGGATNAPSGITQKNGIGSVADSSTAGGAITYAKTIDLITEVSQDNALMGNLYYLTTPQVVGKMRQTAKVSSTDSVMIMDNSNTLNGYPLIQSTLVPSDLTKGGGSSLHAMIFGNFRDVLLCFWSGVDIVVDNSSLSTQGGRRIAFFQDCDVIIRHAQSFAACLDIDVS